jgi:hypothetical protein
VALKYRVPAAATSMSRNGMARGYWTTRSPSVMRTMEAPRSRTSKKIRAMSTPMGNSQALPRAPGQGRILGGVAEGEERQGEGGRGDAQAEEQGGAEDDAQVGWQR